MAETVPKISRFMGRRYRLEFVEKVGEGDRYGETDHVNKLIKVEVSDHEQVRETTLHEVIHQLLYMTEADFPEDVEERVATLLARALHGHMLDNRAFWRWMLTNGRAESN